MLSLKRHVRELRTRLGRRSYSQEGEDLILERYFESRASGFYVDIGAHHPYRFSNTCLLYRKGWCGVNIDAMPGSMKNFARARPRDINLELAVGPASSAATYYMFNEPALNTFDPLLAQQRKVPPWKLIKEIPLKVVTLAEILEDVLPASQHIDLLTLDVEGRELEVLKTNDWRKFRPAMVLVETLGAASGYSPSEGVLDYLGSLGYKAVAKTFNTCFLVHSER